ncbi:MAG: methyltransferase domain-containing protein [Planctomycetes bacterium]|nr:methyltransferase domain-containing protein [Planctomycetota bacterium]
MICALERPPWPFRTASFDGVRAIHVLEHLPDLVAVMSEVARVLRPGGRLVVETPYFTSPKSWTDPTHRHHFTLDSLDYFVDGHRFGFEYTGPLFHLVEKRLSFGASVLGWPGRLLYRLSPRVYEERFAFLFPGRTLHLTLERA